MEQDLLQAQQLLPSIVTVAVRADGGGLQKPDLVIVMQRTDRNARQLRHLLDRMAAHDRSPSSMAI